MKSYIQIEKKFSENKQKDYLLSYLVFNEKKYLINLSYEIVSIFLNKTIRDVLELPSGFKSDEFTIDMGD